MLSEALIPADATDTTALRRLLVVAAVLHLFFIRFDFSFAELTRDFFVFAGPKQTSITLYSLVFVFAS